MKTNTLWRLFAVGSLVVSAMAVSAQSSETVNVVLKEWHVEADKTQVRPGLVTFVTRNHGKEPHELVVLKTDSSPDKLPVSHGKVHEKKAGKVIGEIEEFAAGTTKTATFNLAPGQYVLFCNIAEKEGNGEIESHYEEGMHLVFNVR